MGCYHLDGIHVCCQCCGIDYTMILPMEALYKRMAARFPNPEEHSVRKQLCLAYLRVKLFDKREDKEKLVDLAKLFRKVEKRRGSHRTPVEKYARKFFRQIKKLRGLEASRQGAREYARGQMERGEGIFSPEQLAKKAERWEKVLERQKQDSPFAKVWVIIDPSGVEYRVKSMKKFAERLGLSDGWLSRTAHCPEHMSHHRGFKARFFDPELDSHIPWLHEIEGNGLPSEPYPKKFERKKSRETEPPAP